MESNVNSLTSTFLIELNKISQNLENTKKKINLKSTEFTPSTKQIALYKRDSFNIALERVIVYKEILDFQKNLTKDLSTDYLKKRVFYLSEYARAYIELAKEALNEAEFFNKELNEYIINQNYLT